MSLRILVVEDDPICSEVLVSLLSAHSHVVEVAEDGFGAVGLAREASYDLVFVDYHLPEMDGYALARLLRGPDGVAGREFKMIALTGDCASLVARRGADTLFDRILAKPIDPDRLFALVAEMVAPHDSPRAVAQEASAPAFEDARCASEMLWRTRGLAQAPAAAVLPSPTTEEAARLSCCFRLVSPTEADCVLLLGPAGLAELEPVRMTGRGHLLPVFTIAPAFSDACDASFAVGSGESWSLVASILAGHARRAAKLSARWRESSVIDDRLLAYLFVGNRRLTFRRDASGATSVVESGGFTSNLVIEAAGRLAAKGLVFAQPPKECADGGHELTADAATRRGGHIPRHACRRVMR
jgi:CheY-like chemotaxis protein